MLQKGTDADVITDFVQKQDVMVLSGGLTFAQLSIIAGNNAALIRSGDKLLASLNGIDFSLITESDFTLI